jgi:hypothetical protein
MIVIGGPTLAGSSGFLPGALLIVLGRSVVSSAN